MASSTLIAVASLCSFAVLVHIASGSSSDSCPGSSCKDEDDFSFVAVDSHFQRCPKPQRHSQRRQRRQNKICTWEKKFIVTRLWKNESISSEEVVSVFQEGFGVDVVAFPGFLAYVGSATDDAGGPFFFNVFETKAGAALAQSGAVDFVEDSVLKGKIEPRLFTSGQIQFQFTNRHLCMSDVSLITGKHLSLRTWTALPGQGPGTAQKVLDLFEVGFAPAIQEFPGFQMYLGAKVIAADKSELAFFLNVFDTKEQAEAANEAASDFAFGKNDFAGTACGGLVGKIASVFAQTGPIDFAFLAALRKALQYKW